MFDGKVLGRTFDTKGEAQGVVDGLNKTMPGSATVIRANSGEAFKRCVKSVAAKGKAYSPKGVCAAIGRKKYGKKKFQQMAIAGKRAANARPKLQVIWHATNTETQSKSDAEEQAASLKRMGTPSVSVVRRRHQYKDFFGYTKSGEPEYAHKGWQYGVKFRPVPSAPAKNAAHAKGQTGHRAVRSFFKTNDIDIIFNADPYRAMSTLSSRTGIGHGVEHIDAKEFSRKAPGAAAVRGVDYVNMGDPYTKTLMHDGTKFVLGAWGDWIEKYGARQKNFAVCNPGFDSIRPGSRVTIMVPAGIGRSGVEYKPKSGRAVMRGPAGWVLNMGGPHGTPGIATPENTVKVSGGGKSKGSLLGSPSRVHNSDIVDRVKQQIVELEDRYRIHPTRAIEKSLDALRVKFAKLTRPRGNPVTSIGQGAVRADVYSLKGGQHEVRMRGEEPKQFGSKDAAMKYARLRVHELARNPLEGLAAAESMIAGKQSLTTKLLRKLGGKKNPEGSAEEMYQIFHGLPAEKVIEYREKIHVHEWLWAVGTLSSLHVSNGKKKIELTAPDPNKSPFEDVVMVCMTEDGKQFHFRGGDQSLPLDGIAEAFELTEDDVREHMEVGRIVQMTYRTRKIFEDRGQVNIDFYHDLGKEHAKNKLPLLVYKPLNPSMDIVGGRYKVAPLDKSIKASPGVVG